MTDDRHMDETQPDQTVPANAEPARDPAPTGFGDLPMFPTGSGVADEQVAFEQSVLDAPPEGTAGVGNTGARTPETEGGQSPVGEPGQRETRDTEF